jgi:hypothetical protein
MTTEAEPLDRIDAAVTVKLRRDRFVKVCAERGLNTNAAIATTVGLSERQIERIINDGADPSGRFIGRVLATWPMCSFRALFAVVNETTGEEVR